MVPQLRRPLDQQRQRKSIEEPQAPPEGLRLLAHPLTLVLREYLIHYNGHRPHQSRLQRPPNIETQPTRNVADLRSVRQKPVVAGVISEYHHAA